MMNAVALFCLALTVGVLPLVSGCAPEVVRAPMSIQGNVEVLASDALGAVSAFDLAGGGRRWRR